MSGGDTPGHRVDCLAAHKRATAHEVHPLPHEADPRAKSIRSW